MVGTLAGSGAVSLGLETEASELAFPVISELVGGGVKLECLVGQLQVWASRVPERPKSRLI